MTVAKGRTRVFVSYSNKDRKWLERLQVHLKPLVREGAIALWEDSQISSGEEWRAAIALELSLARVAILLISADFFASDFIAVDELPPLLQSAEEGGALILMLIVSPSRFTESPLARFQAVNDPSEPLIGMKKPQREDAFVRLAAAVHRAAAVAATAEAPEIVAGRGGRPSELLDTGGILGPTQHATLLYDSDREPDPFSGWMLNAHRGPTWEKYRPGPHRSFTMRASDAEMIGINKSLPVLSGAVTFEYEIDDESVPGWHVYFAMIPMQQSPGGLLEVGASRPRDPRNVHSPYRVRAFAPTEHYGDGRWHPGRMMFAFQALPGAAYSIFAPRINEGIDEPQPATVRVRNVRAWTV